MHHFPHRNLRLFVYLGLAWLLHLLIWGLPISVWVVRWGIGGQYYQTRELGKELKKRWTGASSVPEMPWYVELIFWSQFLLFSVFGLVCTWQVIDALTAKVPNVIPTALQHGALKITQT
jgi:hypothetical protein